MGWTIDANEIFIIIEILKLYTVSLFGEETDKRQIISLLIFELCTKVSTTYNSVVIRNSLPRVDDWIGANA